MKIWMKYTICLFLAATAMVWQASAANARAITVGRVYSIEGDLLRYIPEDKDWVAMVNDAPFGNEDALFSGDHGLAEMIIPNGTWLRVGNNTQIQFIVLNSDLSEIDVATGVVRFYNKGSETIIKATSSFGYVLAYPESVFDFYVGENSIEVVAVKGEVSFVHAATQERYEVAANSPSILANTNQVSSGEGTLDQDWHRWNSTRDNYWKAKARVAGRSVRYLPASLQNESYALEENGRWESVPYEGSSRWFWRPTTVARGWSPFTAGRWTEWNGDQVWIPAEPFGYVTHHYGNWIYTRNSWYWAPPVVSERPGLALLSIGFSWSPGRVSWIHNDNNVGWVPLAPSETYYSHRSWGGRHEEVVTNNISRLNINIGSYAYARHAIVVPRDNFYRVENYRNVQVTNTNSTTIINNYHAAAVVNNTVINNYSANEQRHSFTNRVVREKPQVSVINRIVENAPVIQRSEKIDADMIQKQVRNLKEGKADRDNRIEAPKATNFFVPTNEGDRPKSEIQLQRPEIKTGGKQGQPEEPRQVRPVKPAQLEKPAAHPERMAPAKSSQKDIPPEQAVEKPKVKQQQREPVARPNEVKPVRNNADKTQEAKQPEKAVEKPKVKQQQREPVARPNEVRPARNDADKTQEAKQPEKAVEKPKVKQQQREPVAKPNEVKPVRNNADKPREAQQPQKAVEKPRAQKPEKSKTKQQQEPQLSVEELEALKIQKKLEEEKAKHKENKGKH